MHQGNTAYLLIQNGFADWEPASALAELRRTFAFSVKTIGLTLEPALSMGGLKVTPDLSLADFKPDDTSILILPGGDSWTEREIPAVSKAVNAVAERHRPRDHRLARS